MASPQDTRTADGRTNMLRYLAERLVSEEPPQAVLSMQLPHVLSAPLKTSLAVCSPSAPFHDDVCVLHLVTLSGSVTGLRSSQA